MFHHFAQHCIHLVDISLSQVWFAQFSFWGPFFVPTNGWSGFPLRHLGAQEGPEARFAARSALKFGDLFEGAPPDIKATPLVVI